MVSVKIMKFASFSLGLLGIIAAFLVVGSPRPGPDVLPGVPSVRTCLFTPTNGTDFPWQFTPKDGTYFPSYETCLKWGRPSAMKCLDWGLTKGEDFPWVKKGEEFSGKNCLQWELSYDSGFPGTVDEAFGFPGMVLSSSAIHILANLSLLFGVLQFGLVWSSSCFLVVFILYYIVTAIVFIFALLIGSYESLLVAMCLTPMESSAILLYGTSFFLALSISVMKAVLFFCTIVLQMKNDDFEKKIKLANENKTQGAV